MKRLITAITCCLLSATALTQTIKPEDAGKYIGQTVTVCGKIYTTRFLENSKQQPTLLNMGAAFPNQPFTIVIFGESRSNFTYKPEEFLKEKEVCVTGLMKEFNGKPQIVITKEAELQLSKEEKK